MSSLKTSAESGKRSALNTTIDKDVFDAFKAKCKVTGVPMNVLLETFMIQFNEDSFVLRYEDNKKTLNIVK